MLKKIVFLVFLTVGGCGIDLFETTNAQSSIPHTINTCDLTTIEINLSEKSYRAPFTNHEWQPWNNGLKILPIHRQHGLFVSFPNHWICESFYQFDHDKDSNSTWRKIEGCPNNHSLTVHLDECRANIHYLKIHLAPNNKA